jgi:DNA-binding NtrC family response regulator
MLPVTGPAPLPRTPWTIQKAGSAPRISAVPISELKLPPEHASIHVTSPEPGKVPGMSELRDIAAHLHFSPRDGRIWLDDERMMLLHGSVFATLRRELIDTLGVDKARRLLMRVGHSAGSRDATMAVSIRGGRNWTDLFAVGPQLHALEGFVAVEPVRIEIDLERGVHYVEQLWHHSAEAAAHLAAAGTSPESVCWMQIGYASGFNSALFGRPIVFKEVECAGAGDPHCRIVGKPADQWVEEEEQLVVPMASLASQSNRPAFAGFLDANGMCLDADDPELPVGSSTGFRAACQRLQQVAPTQATVLLLGETGVGKERFAKLLHRLSRRQAGPFVALNCAAIPENLLESELFGVERGAYTGAGDTRKGRFERAHGGTLFLDEIGTLNEASQAKLLRALQERAIERLGGTSVRSIDVRVVAATNADLERSVHEGRFRSDLYYRLNVFPIHIPPLRARRDDIGLLVQHFVRKYAKLYDKHIPGFTHWAMTALQSYDYPGNVRELENIIERGVIGVPDGTPMEHHHLFQSEQPGFKEALAIDLHGGMRTADLALSLGDDPLGDIVGRALDASLPLELLELAAMREAVRRANGNLSLAARQLGISRAQLAYRLDKSREI